jgi:P27 family predicted phage terminase small subunit
MTAPDDISEYGQRVYDEARAELESQGTWRDTDAPLLESYVRSLLVARQARKAVSASPFTEGSRGQLVAHPGVKIAADAERDAERYARALLLTPEARSRHQVKGHDDDEPFLAALA